MEPGDEKILHIISGIHGREGRGEGHDHQMIDPDLREQVDPLGHGRQQWLWIRTHADDVAGMRVEGDDHRLTADFLCH